MLEAEGQKEAHDKKGARGKREAQHILGEVALANQVSPKRHSFRAAPGRLMQFLSASAYSTSRECTTTNYQTKEQGVQGKGGEARCAVCAENNIV
jgi:hypothetical protein